MENTSPNAESANQSTTPSNSPLASSTAANQSQTAASITNLTPKQVQTEFPVSTSDLIKNAKPNYFSLAIMAFLVIIALLGIAFSQGWLFQGNFNQSVKTIVSDKTAQESQNQKKEINKETHGAKDDAGLKSNVDLLKENESSAEITGSKNNKVKVNKVPRAKKTESNAVPVVNPPAKEITDSNMKAVLLNLNNIRFDQVNKLESLFIISEAIANQGGKGLKVIESNVPPVYGSMPGLEKYKLAISFGIESKIISLADALDFAAMTNTKFDDTALKNSLAQISSETSQKWFEGK